MKHNEISEFKECLINYFNEYTKAFSIESIYDFAKKFYSHYNHIVIRDNPDGYLVIDNKVIIIEHFEYDATKRNKKGSETRIEDSRIKRKLNSLEKSTSNSKYIHDQMNVTHSTENLRDNFIRVFTEHINKIPQYKKALIQDGVIKDNCDIVVMFCCEDKTTFGCLGYDDNIYGFNIIDIKECLDWILKSEVDYLLLCNSYQNDKCVLLLPVSNEIIKYSKNKMANEIEMIDFKPQVIGASIFIPTNKN